MAAACFVSVSAYPQEDLASTIGGLVQAIRVDQAQAPTLKRDNLQLFENNQRLKKEYDIYAAQLQTRMAPLAAALKAESQRLAAQVNNHNQGVARYTSSCTGTVSQAQYQRCLGEKAYWDRNKASLDGRLATLRTQQANFASQYGKYTNRMNQISTEMKRNFAASEQRKRLLDQIGQRLASYAERLNRACAAAMHRTDPNAREAIRHCHSVRWDGARVNLPELCGRVVCP